VNSLGVFLGQELVRFNGLIEVMKSTLHQLQRAIKGEVVMSGELEAMYNCFVFQKVPAPWESAGYPCLKPLPSWVEDFLRRIQFMGDWLLHGPQNAYWLSGFFFPQGFMTAVKQTYSRNKMIAVDTLRIGCEVTGWDKDDVTQPPEYGAYVYGLFMEAGRFDRSSMTMEDSKPRVLFDEMPCIWLKPVITEEYHPENVYNCPLATRRTLSLLFPYPRPCLRTTGCAAGVRSYACLMSSSIVAVTLVMQLSISISSCGNVMQHRLG